QRISREDLWALRYAYFVLLSETPEGLAELLDCARELANGKAGRTLANMIAPLSRDANSTEFLVGLLGSGRIIAEHVLNCLGHNPDVRAAVRDRLCKDKRWGRQFPFSNTMGKFFGNDPEMQRLVYERIVLEEGDNVALDSLQVRDLVEILDGYEPAEPWLTERAVEQFPHDFNALARARYIRRGESEVRRLVECDLQAGVDGTYDL